MILKAIKTYQTVRVGGTEKTFFNEDYTITLDPATSIITVSNDKDSTITSLNNMAWGKIKEKIDGQGKSTEDSKGTAEKKPNKKAKLDKPRVRKSK